MAWPDWAGPFGIPENQDEFQDFILYTILGYGIGLVGYELGIRHTLGRMASHHYANPSLSALRAQAARQTIFPSVSNAIKIIGSHIPRSQVVRATPPVVATAAATYATVEVVESVAGSTVASASRTGTPNPWWIPLPLYLSIFG